MKQKIFFLLAMICMVGCKNKSEDITVVKNNKKNVTSGVASALKDKNIVENTDSPKFPETGKSIEDFALSPYEIKNASRRFFE